MGECWLIFCTCSFFCVCVFFVFFFFFLKSTTYMTLKQKYNEQWHGDTTWLQREGRSIRKLPDQHKWPLSTLQMAPGGPNALGVRYIEILFSQRRVRFGVSLYLVLSLANLSGLPAVSQAQCQSWGTNVRMLVAIPKWEGRVNREEAVWKRADEVGARDHSEALELRVESGLS